MRPHKRKAGQTLLLTLIALTVIFGCVALSADVGYLRYMRHRMQNAADSAATAAASELNLGTATAAAKTDAGKNGFQDGAGGVSVTVNNPPASGNYSGNGKYVEVIVAANEATFFMSTIGFKSIKVQARAVASQNDSPTCIYALDPSAAGAISMTGNVNIQTSCGILADSSSSSALSATGNVNVTASAIGVVGNYSATGNCKFTPNPKTGIISASDPLSYVQPPAVGACNYTNYKASGNTIATLNPGVYCGGIKVIGNAKITFNPGTYVLAGGGMSTSGNITLSGTGVTFYNTSGSKAYAGISFGGNTQANLSAPTSGPLQAMLFFQDRSIIGGGGSTIVGNSQSTFDGALYFPTTGLTYVGNSSSSGYTIVVTDTLTITGNGSMKNNYSSLANGSPIKTTALAE